MCVYFNRLSNYFPPSDPFVVKLSKMATEALRVDNQQDSIDALAREAESLKKKLAEEKAKLCDVDRKYKS